MLILLIASIAVEQDIVVLVVRVGVGNVACYVDNAIGDGRLLDSDRIEKGWRRDGGLSGNGLIIILYVDGVGRTFDPYETGCCVLVGRQIGSVQPTNHDCRFVVG